MLVTFTKQQAEKFIFQEEGIKPEIREDNFRVITNPSIYYKSRQRKVDEVLTDIKPIIANCLKRKPICDIQDNMFIILNIKPENGQVLGMKHFIIQETTTKFSTDDLFNEQITWDERVDEDGLQKLKKNPNVQIEKIERIGNMYQVVCKAARYKFSHGYLSQNNKLMGDTKKYLSDKETYCKLNGLSNLDGETVRHLMR